MEAQTLTFLVNTSGSQDDSGTAAVATATTIADLEATDAKLQFIVFYSSQWESRTKSNTNLTFNSNTGIVTASGFAGNITGDVTGDVTGNSDTATTLATATATPFDWGVSFDGSKRTLTFPESTLAALKICSVEMQPQQLH